MSNPARLPFSHSLLAVVAVDWSANVAAFGLAAIAAAALGQASARITVLCVIGSWTVAGSLFRAQWPDASWKPLLGGSLLYLGSLLLLLIYLARLDLSTAQTIAHWYDVTHLGGSVGQAIFVSAIGPAFFVLGHKRHKVRPTA